MNTIQNILKIQGILLPLLVCLTVAVVYLPSLKADFVNWDDDQVILNNPLVKSGSSAGMVEVFRRPANKTYVPLTLLTFALEYRWQGMNPFYYHLHNLLLHLAVLLCLIHLGMGLGLSLPSACLAALLFGIHPMHVESVAWITERKDVLYSFFYLLSLIAYTSYIKSKRWWPFVGALICAAFSILSKPMAVSLPWILLLLDYFHKRPWNARLFWEKIPFLMIVLPAAAVTFFLNERVSSILFPQSLLLWSWSAFFYLHKFFLPVFFFPLYPLPLPISFAQAEYALSLYGLILFIYALILFRRQRLFVFAGLFYFGSLFFLFRLDPRAAGVNPVADRFMYLPSLGFCYLCAEAVCRAFHKLKGYGPRIILAAIVALSCVFLSVTAYRQCHIWQSPARLWPYVLKYTPESSLANNNWGEYLGYSGRHQEALRSFSQAVDLAAHNYEALYNQGVSMTLAGRFEDAHKFYNQALELEPRFPKALNNRAYILFHILNRPDEALADLDLALKIDPYHAQAYNNRGMIYEQFKKDPDRAVQEYSKAILWAPDNAEAYCNRGYIYDQDMKKHDLAVQDFSAAIRLDPSFESALLGRGMAYVNLGQKELALKDFQSALSLNANSFAAIMNIGTIMIESKDYDLAHTYYLKAGDLRPEVPLVWFLQGKTLRLLARKEDALSALNKALQLDPRYAEAYYERSLLWEEWDNEEKALSDKLKAQELGWTAPPP